MTIAKQMLEASKNSEDIKKQRALDEVYEEIKQRAEYGVTNIIINSDRFFDEEYIVNDLQAKGFEVDYDDEQGFVVIDWSNPK